MSILSFQELALDLNHGDCCYLFFIPKNQEKKKKKIIEKEDPKKKNKRIPMKKAWKIVQVDQNDKQKSLRTNIYKIDKLVIRFWLTKGLIGDNILFRVKKYKFWWVGLNENFERLNWFYRGLTCKENKFFRVHLGVNKNKLKFGGLKLDFGMFNWSKKRLNWEKN